MINALETSADAIFWLFNVQLGDKLNILYPKINEAMIYNIIYNQTLKTGRCQYV